MEIGCFIDDNIGILCFDPVFDTRVSFAIGSIAKLHIFKVPLVDIIGVVSCVVNEMLFRVIP